MLGEVVAARCPVITGSGTGFGTGFVSFALSHMLVFDNMIG